MLRLACTTAFIAVISTAAFAETGTQHAIPANSFTVTDWYKQSVYDPKDAKIGQIMDVLVALAGVFGHTHGDDGIEIGMDAGVGQ